MSTTCPFWGIAETGTAYPCHADPDHGGHHYWEDERGEIRWRWAHGEKPKQVGR